MPVTLQESPDGKILEAHLTGKLVPADYAQFVPVVERLIREHGRIRLLVKMTDFHGWTAGALWEDMKFDAKHFRDIERLVIVGEKKWEKGMTVFCRPFTTAAIRYFELAQESTARQWLQEP